MSQLFNCAKQIILGAAEVQAQPNQLEPQETIYSIVKDGKGYLQKRLVQPLADGMPALVAIKQMAIECDEAVECDGTRPCTDGGEKLPQPNWKTFEINECIRSKRYTITEDDYLSLCNGQYRESIADAIARAASQIRKTLNKKSIAFLQANATENLGTLTLLDTAGAGLMPQYNFITNAFKKKGLAGIPHVIGGNVIDIARMTYNKQNTNNGIAPNMAGGMNFHYEMYFDNNTSMSTNAYAWMPSTIQLVTYNKYGDASQYHTNVTGMAAVDIARNFWNKPQLSGSHVGVAPIVLNSIDGGDGQTIFADIEIVVDNCRNITLQLSLLYKFINVATQLCSSNFNGVLRFDTCPIQQISCSVPTPPTPAPFVPLCFDWVAPCNANEMIYNMTIGNATYTGIPMQWDGTLATLAQIINFYYGSQVVEYNGTNIVTKSPFDLTGVTGAFNNGANTFNFVAC